MCWSREPRDDRDREAPSVQAWAEVLRDARGH